MVITMAKLCMAHAWRMQAAWANFLSEAEFQVFFCFLQPVFGRGQLDQTQSMEYLYTLFNLVDTIAKNCMNVCVAPLQPLTMMIDDAVQMLSVLTFYTFFKYQKNITKNERR